MQHVKKKIEIKLSKRTSSQDNALIRAIMLRLRDSPVSFNPELFLEWSQLNSILRSLRVVTCTIMWFMSNEAAAYVTWYIVKSRLFRIKNNCSSSSGKLLNKVFNNNLVVLFDQLIVCFCCWQEAWSSFSVTFLTII